MKRNKFIASILTLAAMPLKSVAQIPTVFDRKTKGFKIAAGEGEGMSNGFYYATT